MKSIKLLLNIFILGTLLSVLFGCKVGMGEPQQNSVSKRQKFQQRDSSFSQDIKHQLIGPQIITYFRPKNSRGENISLDSLALSLGYENFSWASYVVKDPYGISNRSGRIMSTPYNDPPKGGYLHDPADKLPFYWDFEHCSQCKSRHHWQNKHNLKQFELVFEDSPADYRLQPGESIEFVTNLVGIKKYDLPNQTATWEVLHTFRWQLTNPRPNMSQVSLLEADVELNQLPPMLLSVMQLDGAILKLGDRQKMRTE